MTHHVEVSKAEKGFLPRTILIADDDRDDRLLAEEALTSCQSSYVVRFAVDGVALIEGLREVLAFSAEPPSLPGLIILDLNMPRMNGLEALKELKSDPHLCRIPVVVWTTSQSNRDRDASIAFGANCFVSKPSSYRDVQQVLCDLARTWLVDNA
jgi:CheY-like chemotaxis protein